jgi:hypothetical protein
MGCPSPGARFVFREDVPEAASLEDSQPAGQRGATGTCSVTLTPWSCWESARRRLVEEKGADPSRIEVIHTGPTARFRLPARQCVLTRARTERPVVLMHSGKSVRRRT